MSNPLINKEQSPFMNYWYDLLLRHFVHGIPVAVAYEQTCQDIEEHALEVKVSADKRESSDN